MLPKAQSPATTKVRGASSFPPPKTISLILGQNSTFMDTLLVASFHSKVETAVELLKKLKGTLRMLKQGHWDDLLFGKMINDCIVELIKQNL